MTVTGSMQRYKPGKWRVRATVGIDPGTGREKRLSRVIDAPWDTEGEELARREKYRLIDQAEQMRRDWENAPESMTVAEAIRRWRDHKRKGWAGATLEAYDYAIARILDDRMGERLVASVTVADIERYYARLDDDGVKPPSIVKVHVVLSGALGLAERWGAIARNPARLASAPTVEAREVDPPEPVVLATQLVALLGEHPAMGAWVLSAAATGMRPGEQCALRWSDLDLDAGTAVIRRAVRKDGRGGWELATTKTRKVRQVALGRKVVDLYRVLRDRQLEQCASIGVPWDPDGYVFMVDATRPAFTNPHLWRQRWTKRRTVEVDGETVERSLREEYGLADVRLYALRHFAATHMVADGHDPVTIGRLLGHNPSMLLSRYAHPVSENARAAVDALDRKLST